MAYPGSTASRLTESAGGTLPLLAYLALAITLMVADQRGGFASQARQQASVLAEPVWWLAASPARLAEGAGRLVSSRSELQSENLRLARELQVSASRLHRLVAVAEENHRLRELLGGTRGYRLSAQLVGIIDIDLDPSRQRIVLDAGSDEGVLVGQAMIDAGGVRGQVIEVTPRRATALLLTDPDHAIPVQVTRSGLRTIAFGTGRTDQLRLPNIPQSADIRVGDRLVTSGIGGRFPAGFPVGVVQSLHPDDTRLFVVAEASPSARLDRGLEVLLVSNAVDEVDTGPDVPPPPPAAAQANAPADGAADPATGPAAVRASGPPASTPAAAVSTPPAAAAAAPPPAGERPDATPPRDRAPRR